MISGTVVLYVMLDSLYMTQASLYGDTDFQPPLNILSIASWYHKMQSVSLIATWLAIVSVKFSFLALFRKLVETLPRLIYYWRVVVSFNLLVSVYGVLIYILACPYYYSKKECRSTTSLPFFSRVSL